MATDKTTVMVISCHPADAVDLAGGTMASHAKEGHRVVIVNLTHGALSHGALLKKGIEGSEEHKLEEIIRMKREESRNAAAVLGATDFIDYEYDDEPFMSDRSRILRLAELILEYRPGILISHHPNEFSHEDHAVAGDMTVRALTAASRWILNAKHDKFIVPSVYFYGVQSRSKQFKMAVLPLAPDVVVDIEHVAAVKVKAFMELKSQKNTEKITWDRMNSMEAETGRLHGFRYAEQFISYYPLKTTLLPLNMDISFYSLLDKKFKEDKG